MKQADRASHPTQAPSGVLVLRGCSRRGLMSTTALQAVAVVSVLVLAQPALTQPALAQLSPVARPTGGVVVAGAASIAQSANRTTITQTSQNAAVNWQTYNIGRTQTVQYIDPSAKSVTLNRVIGPNPSEVAGQIVSNGVVVIVNQAGLLFDGGAQINTAGLVVSAAGISNSNFMAGKMVFDQAPRPGAKIENRGTITIKDHGLAALVAPQVVNSGVIRANLGRVVLAGAETSVLDLYGDGMVSINVTRQVGTAPDGGTALVTNTGVVSAAGGTVLLTAEAVDGVVQTLVNAGGRISANSVGAQTGRVVISGAGGDVIVAGAVSANGRAAGTTGGSVVVNSTGTVTLAPTARIAASGKAGGGTVALGTTLKRAVGGPAVTGEKTAKAVTIAAGATVAADATANGRGGKVTVLSTDQTTMAGSITARGGPPGGDGGFVEVSGFKGFSLAGAVDVSAPLGVIGSILLDPANLDIVHSLTSNGTEDPNLPNVLATDGKVRIPADTVTDFALSGLTGNVTLAALGTLSVQTGVTLKIDTSLKLVTDTGNINVNAGVTTSGVGNISLLAGTVAASGGQIVLNGDLTTGAAGTVLLSADGGIQMNGAHVSTGALTLANTTTGTITQGVTGIISAGTVTGSGAIAAGVTLAGTANAIGTIGALGVTGATNDFTLTNAANLTVAGALTATRDVRLTTTGATSITATGGIGAGGTLSVSSGTGGIALKTGATLTGPTISLDGSSGGIALMGNAALGNASTTLIKLAATGGGVTEAAAAVITAGTLVSNSGPIVGNVRLLGTQNAIATLGSNTTVGAVTTIGTLAATGDIQIRDTSALTIADGALVQSSTGNVYLQSSDPGGITFGASGTVAALGLNKTVGLQTDKLTNLGTTGATGVVLTNAGTFELAPNTIPTTVTLGTNGASLSLSTLDGITAQRVRIGAVTAPGAVDPITLISAAPTLVTTATAITVGAQFDAAATHVLELDALGDVTQSAAPLVNVGTLTGSAANLRLTDLSNTIGTLGSFTATGAFLLNDGTGLTIAGPVVAQTATVAVAGTLQISGTIGSCGLLGDTTLTSTGAMTVLDPALIFALQGRVDLEAGAGFSQTGGTINAQNVAVHAAAGSIVQSGGLIAAVHAIDVNADDVTAIGGFTENGGTMSANGAISVTAAALLNIDAGTIISGSSIQLNTGGTLTMSGGTVVAGTNLSITANGDVTQTGGYDDGIRRADRAGRQ